MDTGIPLEHVMSYMSSLSKLITSVYSDDDFKLVTNTLTHLNYSTERLMLELMQPCDLMVANCTWLGKPTPCRTIFRVAKSTEGFCCSFNYKGPLDYLEV